MNFSRWSILTTVLIATGCANPSVSTVRNTKAAPAYNMMKAVQPAAQPAVDKDSYRKADSGRTYSLTLKNADIRDVLLLLSKESGVPIIPERGVSGSVRIEAQNKKLGELLYGLLKPLGYTATLENGVILVGKPQLSTRTFRVNYIKDKRNSSSNTNVSGFSGSGSSGSVSISTEAKSDFWGALESSLELLVFGTSNMGKRDAGAYVRGENEKKTESKSDKTPGDKSAGTDMTDNGYAENKSKQLLVNEIAGIIQITDYAENLDKIALFLSDVEEGSKRQVLIQAHIMEVSLKDSFSLGIDWKYIFDKTTNLTLAQTLSPSSLAVSPGTAVNSVFKIAAGGVNNNFSFLMDAMKEQGNINMLSSPKITALNNQKAVIKLTTKQVSWVTTKTTNNSGGVSSDTFTTAPQIDEVGIFLDVTPQIGREGEISMQIHPSVSEIKEISTSPDKTSNKPIIDVREIDTLVEAKAGETIVIAGLISDKLAESKRSIPLLGDIPYLGALFSYNSQDRTKAELVIMMTPYVLNAKSIEDIRADHEKRLRNMGDSFHLINNLGSLVTEKSSRDLKLDNEPLINNKNVPADTHGNAIDKINRMQGLPMSIETPGSTQKKSEQAAAEQTQLKPSPLPVTDQPVAPQPSTQHAPQPAPTIGSNLVIESAPVKTSSKTAHDSSQPELRAIRATADTIQLDIANIKQKPVILREKKAKLVIVKLPGVRNKLGSDSVSLALPGFSHARIARHTDGLWVVLHSSAPQLPVIREHSDNNQLNLVVVQNTTDEQDVVKENTTKTAGAKKSHAEYIESVTANIAKPARQPESPGTSIPAELPSETPNTTGKPTTVVTTSVTTNREQILYRSAVTAYKIGDCQESIKSFDSFIKLYPNSPFSQDAAYYRKDCLDRTSSATR